MPFVTVLLGLVYGCQIFGWLPNYARRQTLIWPNAICFYSIWWKAPSPSCPLETIHFIAIVTHKYPHGGRNKLMLSAIRGAVYLHNDIVIDAAYMAFSVVSHRILGHKKSEDQSIACTSNGSTDNLLVSAFLVTWYCAGFFIMVSCWWCVCLTIV